MKMNRVGQEALLEENLLEGKFLHPSYLNKFDLNSKNTLSPISIILPTYNRSPHSPEKDLNPLGWCLESLLTQKGDCFNEIIIIDDGSKDYTEDVVKNIQETFSVPIIYLKNKKNLGSSISRNLAVSHSKNDYILFLDDDCISCRNMLFGAAYTLSKLEKSIVAVHLPVYHRKTSPKLINKENIGVLNLNEGTMLGNFDGFPVEYVDDLENNFLDQELKILKPLEINNLGGVFLIRKEPFIEIGGFPEFFTWKNGYREETDVALRLSERGYKMVLTPDPKFYCVHLRYGANTKNNEECLEPDLKSFIEQSNIPRSSTGNRIDPEEWFYCFLLSTYTTLGKRSHSAAQKYSYSMYKTFVVQNNLRITGVGDTIDDMKIRRQVFNKAMDEGNKLMSTKTN